MLLLWLCKLGYGPIPALYHHAEKSFRAQKSFDDDNSAVRISIHSCEKRTSALDLTPEGDMNRALLAASLHGHFEYRAFRGVSRSDL